MAEGRRDLSENVLANYESHLARHIAPTPLGRMRLTGVQPTDVRAFINSLVDAGLANSTVRHVLAVISGGFKTATRDGVVARNPVSLVKLPRPAPPQTDTLTPSQVRRLLAVAADDPLFALWLLAPTLGCRQGELLGLRWANITLDGPYPEVRIEASVKRVRGKGLVLGTPKTASANRSIPLDAMHVEALRHHRARQNEIRLRAGSLWQDEDLVFCTTTNGSFGKPLDARWVRRRWKRLLKQAGLEDIKFHALRHTAFTQMAAAQINPETIRQIAGHSDVRVTLSVYTHPTATMKREAIGQLGRLYEQAVEVGSEDRAEVGDA